MDKNESDKEKNPLGFFVAFILFMISIYISERYSPLTIEEQFVFNLVSVPFGFGVILAMAPKGTIFVYAGISMLLTLGVRAIYPLIQIGSTSPDLVLRNFGMALTWSMLGYYTGTLCFKYVMNAGWRVYTFALSASIVSLSLSSLLTESLLPWFLDNDSVEIKQLFGAYFLLLMIGLFMLNLSSTRPTILGLKSVSRQILSIVSVFGILDFVLFELRDQYISEILWWVSDVNPPGMYSFTFTLAMAGIITARRGNPEVKISSKEDRTLRYVYSNRLLWVTAISYAIVGIYLYASYPPLINDLPQIVNVLIFIVPFFIAGQTLGWGGYLLFQTRGEIGRVDSSWLQRSSVRVFWKYIFSILGYTILGYFLTSILGYFLKEPTLGFILGNYATAWLVHRTMIKSVENIID